MDNFLGVYLQNFEQKENSVGNMWAIKANSPNNSPRFYFAKGKRQVWKLPSIEYWVSLKKKQSDVSIYFIGSKNFVNEFKECWSAEHHCYASNKKILMSEDKILAASKQHKYKY